MSYPLGEPIRPKAPAAAPEWTPHPTRPGVWQNRDKPPKYRTWTDNEGRPKAGPPHDDPVPVWPFNTNGQPYIPITQPLDIEC